MYSRNNSDPSKKWRKLNNLERFHFFSHSIEIFSVVLKLGENGFEAIGSIGRMTSVSLTSASGAAFTGDTRAFGAFFGGEFNRRSAVSRSEAATTRKSGWAMMSLFVFGATGVAVTCTRCIVYIKSWAICRDTDVRQLECYPILRLEPLKRHSKTLKPIEIKKIPFFLYFPSLRNNKIVFCCKKKTLCPEWFVMSTIISSIFCICESRKCQKRSRLWKLFD